MSRVGTRPTRSNSLRAMIENSASPLPEAMAPTAAVEAEISPATGACTSDGAAFGQRQPRQGLAGGDGIAGIRQHFGDLQPHPLGPHLRLLARNDDAGHFDDIAEAGFRRLQHRDRGALRLGAASSAANAAGAARHSEVPTRRAASVSRANRLIGGPFPVLAGHGYQIAVVSAARALQAKWIPVA